MAAATASPSPDMEREGAGTAQTSPLLSQHADGEKASALGGNATAQQSTTTFDGEKTGASTLNLGEPTGSEAHDAEKQSAQHGRKRLFIIAGVIALLLLAIVIAVPVGVVVGRKHSNSVASSSPVAAAASASSSSSASVLGGAHILQGDATGVNGSTIYPLNGSSNTFTYTNTYGGRWSAIPFDNSAQAQDDTPPLNQSWDFGTHTIRGVNLGGWFTLEPFICSDIFERFINDTNPAVDEWQLSEKLDAVGPGEKKRVFEDHYSNFVTEQDFAQIAGAGLNWVRISFPFWAIETYPDEPYYTGAWPHFLNAIAWARKYGIRINLDFHALPGSQNGWDHSGRRTFSIGWMRSAMGIANAQRSLNYMRTLAQFISQPEYTPVVAMFSIVNEIQVQVVNGYNGTTQAVAESFYGHAYQMLRNITGKSGPYITIHEGFSSLSNWYGFLHGADRAVMDTHPYLCFGAQQSTGSIASRFPNACDNAAGMRNSMRQFGPTIGGEWSLAINDCSYLLNGVGPGYGSRYDGTYAPSPLYPQYFGSCDQWNDWQSWNTSRKQDFQKLGLYWMDALGNSFFWTWKLRKTLDGRNVNPMDYSLGLQNGWIAPDIRKAPGSCNALDSDYELPCNNVSCPAIPVAASVDVAPFPPASLVSATTTYYYTATQTPITLPVSTPTAYPSAATATANPGNGWFNPSDTAMFFTPVSGAAYPDAWTGYIPATEDILKRRAVPTAVVA